MDGFFEYPRSPHARQHGPQGYSSYNSYKPWLRDEFSFRCVYCLIRELWHGGSDFFGVDHLKPRRFSRELECLYDNLVYACNRCNWLKGDRAVVPDPCEVAYGLHLRVDSEGLIVPMSDEGRMVARVFLLNQPELAEFRRRLRVTIARLVSAAGNEELAESWLCYPRDLPDLCTLRPPEGNTRPNGAVNCCFERRRRGELDSIYLSTSNGR